jgi:hypothetical protein
MKAYPSIPRSTGMTFQEIPNAYVFDKQEKLAIGEARILTP